MSWYWWAILGLVVLFSLYVAYTQGYRHGVIKGEANHRWLEHYLVRWITINDHFVAEVSKAGLEGEDTSHKRNIRLLYENRNLRKKVVRLAFKYGEASRLLKLKPTRDALSDIVWAMAAASAKVHEVDTQVRTVRSRT